MRLVGVNREMGWIDRRGILSFNNSTFCSDATVIPLINIVP